MLNLWRCAAANCTSTALGVGGGVGLRAIGWWFEQGGGTYCPAHRPDSTMLRASYDYCTLPAPCGVCAGEYEAALFQHMISKQLELEGTAWLKQRLDKWAERPPQGAPNA